MKGKKEKYTLWSILNVMIIEDHWCLMESQGQTKSFANIDCQVWTRCTLLNETLRAWSQILILLTCTETHGTSRPVYIHVTEIRTWSDAFKIIEFITDVLLCRLQRLYFLTVFPLVHYQRHYKYKISLRAICRTRYYLMRTSLQYQDCLHSVVKSNYKIFPV